MNENLAAFLRVLDSKDNTTGGGTASAVAGAMAGALIAMVARLSIGKKGMEVQEFYDATIKASESLSQALFDGGKEDSQAFEAVRAAYRLEKQTDEEQALRVRAIQAAWTKATRVPLTNAESCAALIALAESLLGRSNPSAASDLDCALHLARAGLLGCLANVEINLPALKDNKEAAAIAKRARELAIEIADNTQVN